MADLSIKEVTRLVGERKILDRVHLQIPEGDFFSILGPSGCGKTTCLRIIAGLDFPTSGKVLLGEKEITHVEPFRRPINTVFQNYALFPHLTVFENIAFGLKLRKIKGPELARLVSESLDLVNLPGYEKRSVSELSGGEKQRIALARAVVNDPEILLLDEPLAALDLQLRKKMQFELKAIHRRLKNTFIFVTHDQEEALALSDRIAVMNDGRVEQIGTPQEIYSNPRTVFVAGFIGSSNLFPAKVLEIQSERRTVRLETQMLGQVNVPAVESQLHVGQNVSLLIRPEKIRLKAIEKSDGEDCGIELKGEIFENNYMGADVQYQVKTEKLMIKALAPHDPQQSDFQYGDMVRLRLNPSDLKILVY